MVLLGRWGRTVRPSTRAGGLRGGRLLRLLEHLQRQVGVREGNAGHPLNAELDGQTVGSEYGGAGWETGDDGLGGRGLASLRHFRFLLGRGRHLFDPPVPNLRVQIWVGGAAVSGRSAGRAARLSRKGWRLFATPSCSLLPR